MATTRAVVKTRITETFTITARTGETYQVEEHTRYEATNTAGVKGEVLGRAHLMTTDGRGVIKNHDDNTYSIPSLGVKATR